ncbi:MAG: acetoacetyl-CoA reductase [Gammaproteobacteria bacterium]
MGKKIVLVTGGVRGIGSAICREFLKSGKYFVIASATNAERNKIWVEQQKKDGFSDVDAVVCNVTDYAECQKVLAELKSKYTKIDVLINNAGITRDITLKKMAKEDWDKVIETNLNSLFNVTKPILDMMLDNGYGRIVNMSSVNALRGQFGQTNYAAAKAGIYGFTKSLALETARKNITVNSISPGYIMTDMMKDIPGEVMEKIIAQIPVGRLGQGEEVARLAVFLADDASGYITGADFSINGGLCMY